MLDLIGSLFGMAAILVCAIAILTAIPLSQPQRLIAGGVFGAWVGFATAVAATGALAVVPSQPVPTIALVFGAPLLTFAMWALVSPSLRAKLMAMPLPVLIRLNGLRLIGGIFLVLAAVGRLSGPFPYSAGIGDLITGAIAIPLALRVARGDVTSVGLWNAFGTLDLILAVGFGVTSADGSPLQIFHVGVGSAAVQQLPFALVPTVLVPFFLIVHGVIAGQLAARRKVGAFAAA